MTALDPFYLIVDDAAWLKRLLPLGVKLVQLRIKDRGKAALRAQIHDARALCAQHSAQLVINDHWRLAIEEGCDFVHLGQGDLDDADIAALQHAGVKIGVSTHDEAELTRALALKPDYVALGPVWPTLLKEMKFAPQGVEKLREWKRRIGDIPLVSIGGLTPHRAALALLHGADSACVVTDILRNKDPEARTTEWLKATAPWRDAAQKPQSFQPDYPGARVLPSPNHGERQRPVSALVLHYTGMPTEESALELLVSPAAEVSAHYVVAEDGRVLQLVPEARRAWHAGRSFWAGETDLNSASVGIEIVHPGHADPRPYAAQQIAAVIALSRDICARHGIPPERVLAHSDIAPARKQDPGEFFPWDALAEAGVGLFPPDTPGLDATPLTPGAEGPKVTALQRDLAAFGYAVEQTASYDDQTALAVTAFQRHFRPARVDGCADAQTRLALAGLVAISQCKV